MAKATFLSVVVPFHNSTATCQPLLNQFAQLDGGEGVELILVDDGSVDATPRLLRDFAKQARTPVHVIEREHGGPGAARNTGLDLAGGKFVWFVDSDDTIHLGAISLAKEASWPDVDLVVWDWDHPSIVQRLFPGLHSTRDGPASPGLFDPIVCNWFSRSFLQRARLRFPEFCFYEATPIEFFILPLLVDRYLKVDFSAYRANTKTPSITRSPGQVRPGKYDCLHTIPLGMAFVDEARLDAGARTSFEEAFIRTFLWYVIGLSPLPGATWARALRILRHYRTEANRFGIRRNPLALYPGRAHSSFVMRLLWLASAMLPSQRQYFQQLRERDWPREIFWQAPEMPSRYR